MDFFDILLGNATEIDAKKVVEEFNAILINGEQIEKAFVHVRDLVVFTNKRLILVDKQGISGKRAEYLSIPYKSVNRFSKAGEGHFDLYAELKIWLSGTHEPVVKTFTKDNSIHDIYKILSDYVLK